MSKSIILGIETSCDETAVAVCQKQDNGVTILSNIVASSLSLQSKFGGIIPEQAAREQLKSIIPVIQEAFQQAQCKPSEIDAIAVTKGPGLIGSLLVGVETAKTLAVLWDKPLIPINHLIGHFYANWINGDEFTQPIFPAVGLLVSGGHTDLILMKGHGKYNYLGGTRDDAAGEAFDKTARLIGLPYPGGPAIAKLAESGNSKRFQLPKPMLYSSDLDFSFSGLKTAVLNLVRSQSKLDEKTKADIASSIQEAIVEVLVAKVIKATRLNNVEQIIVAGGVAANRQLSQTLKERAAQIIPHVGVLIPPPKLCTDNAVYIAGAAVYNWAPIDPLLLQASPNLSLLH